MSQISAEGFRLSLQQRALWDVQGEGDPALAWAQIALSGTLAPGRLREALQRLVERHQALATLFVRPRGLKTPLQAIDENPALYFQQEDLSAAADGERQRLLAALLAAESEAPCDLEAGPRLRALLVTLGPGEALLYLRLPALCADHRSLVVLTADLAALYDDPALADDEDEEPVQYLQFSEWQVETVADEESEEARLFWRQQEAHAARGLRLPLEAASGDAVEPRVRHRLGSFAGVPALLAGRGIAAETFFLACWHVLLGGLSGHREVTTGLVLDGRKYDELADAVGPFATLVPIRSRWREGDSFPRLWERLAAAIGEAAEVQEFYLPGEGAEALDFAVECGPVPEDATGGGVRFRLQDHWSTGHCRALLLRTSASGEEILGELMASAERFSPAFVALLGDRLASVVASVVADPDQVLDHLELLGASERREIVVERNRTAGEVPERGLNALLAEAMAARPGDVALSMGDRELTFAGLAARSRRLAYRLRRAGVEPEVLVGVCLRRSPELIITLVAVLEAGGAFLPLDPSYPEDRLRFMLRDAGAACLVTEEALLALDLGSSELPVLTWEKEMAAPEPETPSAPPAAVAPEHLAYVLYTSGSTGRPKGIMISQGALANHLCWSLETYEVAAGSGTLMHSSISFDFTLTSVFTPLLAGRPVEILPEDEGIEGLADLLRRRTGYSLLKLTPAHLEILNELPTAEIASATRVLVLGGEALQAGAVAPWRRHAPEVRLINEYGPTETVVGCAVHEVGAGDPTTGPVSMGRPITNLRLYLLDRRLAPVPCGVAGQIAIGGAGLARGYRGRPALTAAVFVPDPLGEAAGERLYLSGDLARLNLEDGLEFLGRIDHQVKIRGLRIELGEIEARLTEHPGVREALVDAAAAEAGPRLVCYYVRGGERPPEDAALRDFLRAYLPEHMVPRSFFGLDAFPLTPNGKVDRQALRDLEAAPEARVEPTTESEILLASLYGQLLGVEEVGVSADFFELGGHSVLAMQLIARIQKVFQLELAIADLVEESTVSGLAARIDRGMTGAELQRPPIVPVDPGVEVPLSSAQERFWFMEQLQPGTAVYNLPAAFDLHGALDVRAMAAAVQAFIARHEVLRTRFAQGPRGPRPVVDPVTEQILPLVDLGGLDPARGRAEAEHLTRVMAHEPLDPMASPLLRLALLRHEEEEHRLLFTLHHIVSDEWSMRVLFQECTALYRAFKDGVAPELPELPVQYGDYAAWQREWLSGEVFDGLVGFWRRQLAEYPHILELPTSRPRPPVESFRGAKLHHVFPPHLARRVPALARQERVTPFMFYLALYQVFLARLTGQRRFLVGTPMAGRHHTEIEGLMGCFINTLVIPAEVPLEKSFRDFLGEVRAVTLASFAHGDLPFEKLIEVLHVERSRSRPPLVQAVLSLQHGPALEGGEAEAELAGLSVVPVPSVTDTAKVDLNVELRGDGESLAATVEYATDLFDRTFVRRLLEALQVLLESALDHPDRAVGGLAMLSAGERQQVAFEWSVGVRYRPEDERRAASTATFLELLAARSAAAPEALALVFEDQFVSYGELERRGNQLAHHLRGLGIGPESVVGICMHAGIDRIVALLGVLKAGGAYLPLDPSYPQERLDFMVDDAHVALYLTREKLADNLLTTHVPIFCLDSGREVVAAKPQEAPTVPLVAKNAAYVIYTSGSTGRPKGVVVHHGGLANLALAQTALFDVRPLDRVLQFAALSFDASVSEVAVTLAAGATLVMARRDDLMPGPDFVGIVHRHRVTSVTLPPSALAVMSPAALPGLRTIVVAGEACPSSLMDHWAPGRRFINAYGPTEGTVCATLAVARPGCRHPPIGRPIPGAEVYVVSHDLRPVLVGAIGELTIGGCGVARGYHERPALTATKFVPSPFSSTPGERLYRTGDRVKHLADGQLEFLGRMDHQVKVRGFRIEVGEIEAALGRHRAVRRGVVVVSADAAGQAQLVAYVTATAGESPEPEVLREFLGQRLPSHAVPGIFVPLERFPLTPSGKVDRRALPHPSTLRTAAQPPASPTDPVEEVIAGIWCEVLGLDACGARENFFDLGGNSLIATQVLGRLREIFEVALPVGLFFEEPTVRHLAREIRTAARGEAEAPIPAATASQHAPLSSSQEEMWRLHEASDDPAACNVAFALRIDGALESTALRSALGELADRHQILRTVFPRVAGRPVQRVMEGPGADWEEMDLSVHDEADFEGEFQRLGRRVCREPFDLEAGPLVRHVLVRLHADAHILLVVQHHILVDPPSRAIWSRELTALYAAAVEGGGPPLAELPIQYADYARWQHQRFAGEGLAVELDSWRQQLDGVTPVCFEKDPGMGGRRVETLVIEGELLTALRRISREASATLAMTVLAAFAALVGTLTGADVVPVASPATHRDRRELERLIGFFANSLILRCDLAGDPTFRDLIRRVRRRALAAYEHRDLPFGRLVEELAADGVGERGAWMRVGFNYQEAEGEEVELANVEVTPVDLDLEPEEIGVNESELLLVALRRGEASEALELSLQYLNGLSGVGDGSLAGRFHALLTGVAEAPEKPLSAVVVRGAGGRGGSGAGSEHSVIEGERDE